MKPTLFFFRGMFLCMLFFAFSINAQTVSTAYATQINSTFANLDKTKVPQKLLIDYAMEFAELSAYNGTLTTDNILHRGHYTAIYNTLLMSRVQSTVTGLVNPTTFRTNWDNLRQPNKIVLSGLYYKYNQFKTDASPNYLTITNNKFYDKYVNGVWQNPYDEKQVFAMASPILKYNDLTAQVELPASLWYTNQSSSVQSIAIDFGDGLGYQTITMGQLKTVTYSQSGLYEWKYKLTLTTNQILYSHSKIEIEGVTNTSAFQRTINQPCTTINGVDLVTFTGTRSYAGQVGSAKLQIDYASNDCIIRKPLIVVEGFDSGIMGVENPLGESDYFGFRGKATTILAGNLNGQLNTYDIIYVNWDNGKDDMHRNAYLLEDIIKWVNTQKENPTIAHVVLGQSMGGVIARYALRDMENQLASTGSQTWNHKTSLYISHDAPQQGANIPLGIQYFARHIVDQLVSTPLNDMNINPQDGAPVTVEDIKTLLDATGTKQLLTKTVTSGFVVDNVTSTAWQTELRNLGYPQQTRNIAISNGNHCAIPQAFAPASVLFSLTGNAKATVLTDMVLMMLQPIANAGFTYAAIKFNQPGLMLGVLPGNSKFDMNFTAKALPTTGTTTEIYKGRITFTKKFIWFNITTALTDRSYNNPAGILSYDYYPGGKYNVPFSFQNSSVSNLFFSYGISAVIADNFDFIPTPSALDIGGGAVALTDADYFKKYTAAAPPAYPKNSPFVNFTTSFPNGANINENHISFNTRNGNWLATELDSNVSNNQVFDCTYVCNDAQITGSDYLCTTGTYSVPAGGTSYNWTITQGASLVSLSGNGTQNITLTAVPYSGGNVTLSLTMGNPNCGSTTLTKTIWVGLPAFSVVRDATQNETCDTKSHYVPFYINIPANATFQLVSSTPSVTYTVGTNNLYTFKFAKGYSGAFNFVFKATNSCGTYFYDSFEEGNPNMIKSCANLGLSSVSTFSAEQNTIYSVYPNPSSDVININLRDENNLPETQSQIVATLYNMMGELKGNVSITDNIASISVSNLSKGIYILKINIDGNVENHQVVVE